MRAELDAAIEAQQQQHNRIVILQAEMQRLAIDARATTNALEAEVQRLHEAVQRVERRAEEATATTAQQGLGHTESVVVC